MIVYNNINPLQIYFVFCNLAFTSLCASPCQVQSILCCIHSQPGLPDSSPHGHHNRHAARPQVQWRHYGIKHTNNTLRPTGYSYINDNTALHFLSSPLFRHTWKRTRHLSCWMMTMMMTMKKKKIRTISWKMKLRQMSMMLQGRGHTHRLCTHTNACIFITPV